MSDSENTGQPQTQTGLKETGSEDSDQTHPVCRFAPDKESCEKFVERLSQASNNIDRRA